MTPILGAAEDSPESSYNKKQMRCRALIEQCNGVLKMRFRCLLKHRVLHYSPPIAAKIINTCAVLHNIYISENVPMPLDLNDVDEDFDLGININRNNIENGENNPERNIQRINPDLAAGRRKQQQMIRNYFA